MSEPAATELSLAKARRSMETAILTQEHRWLLDAFGQRQRSDGEVGSPATQADVVDLQQKAAQFLMQTEAFLERRREEQL